MRKIKPPNPYKRSGVAVVLQPSILLKISGVYIPVSKTILERLEATGRIEPVPGEENTFTLKKL